MGGRSRSSTSSRSSSVVRTDNSNVQQNDNEVALNLKEVSGTTINVTDGGAVEDALEFGTETVEEAFAFSDDTVEEAFSFGGDALDEAFRFGTESLNNSQEFGRDILEESQETNREALRIAGNAQTNAFNKIKDIASLFNSSTSSQTATILLSIGGAVIVLGLIFFFRKR